jgi:hypothetical protein
VPPSLPSRRAFLVRYTDDADPRHGRVSGRVEHLDSGESLHFSSQEELNEFIARSLSQENTKPAGAGFR